MISPPPSSSSSSSRGASGIELGTDVRSDIDRAKRSGTVCFLKIILKDDKFKISDTVSKPADISRISQYVEGVEPAFFIYFKGLKELSLLFYMPDNASAKNKMVYSTAKGALTSYLEKDSLWKIHHYYACNKNDLSPSAINGHAASKGNKQDTSAMSNVERALKELAPTTLSKNELTKSAGFSLLAQISGKAPPPQLKGLNLPAPPSSTPQLSVKVAILNKDRDKIYAADKASKCVMGDCIFKRWARGYCEKHAKIYRDIAVAGDEGGTGENKESNEETTKIIIEKKSFDAPKKISTAEEKKKISNTEEKRKSSNTEEKQLESGVRTFAAPRLSISRMCAFAGCGEARVSRGYCAKHANESIDNTNETQTTAEPAAVIASS